MSGVRLELANPNEYESPKAYVEQHLAPVVATLHRAVEELLQPGASSAEEWAVDMAPPPLKRGQFSRCTRHFDETPKHVFFDGSEYLSIPPAVLREKQLKVQFQATVYQHHPDGEVHTVRFRLVGEDGGHIEGSSLSTRSPSPVTFTQILPFARDRFSIKPEPARYYIEASTADERTIPVCRRFSLSFIYI